MAYSKPARIGSGGLTPSREALELGGLLTPEDSIMNSGARKKQTYMSDPGLTAKEELLTHSGPSSSSPDGRPGGLPFQSDERTRELLETDSHFSVCITTSCHTKYRGLIAMKMP
jgi:hypothetical protein